jgi:choline monooxygenase
MAFVIMQRRAQAVAALHTFQHKPPQHFTNKKPKSSIFGHRGILLPVFLKQCFKMYQIHPDIRYAATLPGSFYTTQGALDACRTQIFERSWQLCVGAEEHLRVPKDAWPFEYMDGFIQEPLLLLRDENNAAVCLSNVCTHRGKILVEHPMRLDRGIICGYHGRRFGLDGQFAAMPATEGMENFPCAADHLSQVAVKQWRQFLFTSLDPHIPFDEWVGDMEHKIGFLPLEDFRFDPVLSRDYLVKANWALYCDNYLEGFHIPFIHPALAKVLDGGAYRTELYPWGNCQVGISKGGDDVFKLPLGHPDAGQQVAAYYFWLFPNLMFNFYPWGLSINIVRPLQPDLCKVSFRTYVLDRSKLFVGAGADIDRTEREDEAVVEKVQMGVRSRFYQHGRFSPTKEQGVHQFHCLVDKMFSI